MPCTRKLVFKQSLSLLASISSVFLQMCMGGMLPGELRPGGVRLLTAAVGSSCIPLQLQSAFWIIFWERKRLVFSPEFLTVT